MPSRSATTALRGKVVLDLSNELVAVGESFPLPVASAENSLGQRLKAIFSEALLVKALSTMNHRVMVRPAMIPGDHLAFLCGDDAGPKDAVRELLESFGW